jgi:hypothetical protein
MLKYTVSSGLCPGFFFSIFHNRPAINLPRKI